MRLKNIPRSVLRYTRGPLKPKHKKPKPPPVPMRTGRMAGMPEYGVNADGQRTRDIVRAAAPFRVGEKKLYLPSSVITLQHTPHHPPNYAQFIVPLSFTKLDIRDYLWHAYGVVTHGVRSSVVQQPVQRVQPGDARDLAGKPRIWRPRSIKKMLVELARPFVWPPALSDEVMDEAFEQSTVGAGGKKQEEAQAGAADERARRAAAFAKGLREGRVAWKADG